ncbi:S41 family peptidase [Costertonia aggregata]|uniref:Tail specific protease domain-containing protein n=1 Tax=Costertonia aggregata TaxID=343403 RepID=A0A7H9AMM8_9FLAO|nr:S41 family peptidase [Costertonia aggregata]QLG44712.1 hypothetical protein HYG79_04905 [Costertonia aggregata]
MKKILYIVIVSIFLFSFNANAQSLPDRECNCSEVFEELTEKLESNYLAYKKLVEADQEKKYKNLKHSYNRLLKNLTADNCTRMLQLFLQEFDDGHLFVFEEPEYTSKEKAILQREAKKNRKNVDAVLKKLEEQGHGKVTGIWSDGNYEIAVIQEGEYFKGYTITWSDTLPAGSLLASFKKGNMNGRMHGTWYNYNNEPKFIEADLSKENTLLNFSSENKWGRIVGKPKREVAITNKDDITQPSIQFLDDETTLFTIPSFSSDPSYLQQLLLKNAESVATRTKLIIDVRGNTGGNAVYFGFIPVYATQGLSASVPGEVLASEDTKNYFERLVKSNPNLYQPVVNRIEKNMGEIVEGPAYPARPFESYPSKIEKVAILADGACASACESFILHSKAMSNKVKVYGSNTAGVIDYTSVTIVKLFSSGNQNIYFGFPTSSLSKSYLTDAYPNGYNTTGINPDVTIPSTVADKVLYVMEKMDE